MKDDADEERLDRMLRALDRLHQDLSDAMETGEAIAVVNRLKAELLTLARDIDEVAGLRQGPLTR